MKYQTVDIGLDRGKPLTGDDILGDVHSIGKYSFCLGFIDRDSGEIIMEETAIYEPEYKQIISELTAILTVTDLRVGEEVFSQLADCMITVMEREWCVLRSGKLFQPHLRLFVKCE